nr:hypothetical protein [Dokdonella sp.]
MNKILAGVFLLLVATTPVHAAQSPAARTIVVVRHGHYVPVPSMDEKPGPGLSPLGVAQAR